MSDGEHEITWVTVSADGGETCKSKYHCSQRAEFLNEPQLWTWQLQMAGKFRVRLDAARSARVTILKLTQAVVRAWDSAANSYSAAGDHRQRLEFQGLCQQRLASSEDYVDLVTECVHTL